MIYGEWHGMEKPHDRSELGHQEMCQVGCLLKYTCVNESMLQVNYSHQHNFQSQRQCNAGYFSEPAAASTLHNGFLVMEFWVDFLAVNVIKRAHVQSVEPPVQALSSVNMENTKISSFRFSIKTKRINTKQPSDQIPLILSVDSSGESLCKKMMRLLESHPYWLLRMWKPMCNWSERQLKERMSLPSQQSQ